MCTEKNSSNNNSTSQSTECTHEQHRCLSLYARVCLWSQRRNRHCNRCVVLSESKKAGTDLDFANKSTFMLINAIRSVLFFILCILHGSHSCPISISLSLSHSFWFTRSLIFSESSAMFENQTVEHTKKKHSVELVSFKLDSLYFKLTAVEETAITNICLIDSFFLPSLPFFPPMLSNEAQFLRSNDITANTILVYKTKLFRIN